MPPTTFEYSYAIHDLKDSAAVDQFPSAAARFVVVLLQRQQPLGILFGIEEVLKRLAAHDIKHSAKAALIEQLALHGITPPVQEGSSGQRL